MFDWVRNLFNSVWSSKPVVPDSTETDNVPTAIKKELVVQTSSTIDKHEPREELIECGLENEAVNLTMHDAQPEVNVTPVLCVTPALSELKQVTQDLELDIKHEQICAITPELNEIKVYAIKTTDSEQLGKLAGELVADIIDTESKNEEGRDEKTRDVAHSDNKGEEEEEEEVDDDDDDDNDDEEEEKEKEDKGEKEEKDGNEKKETQEEKVLEEGTKPEHIEKCAVTEDIDTRNQNAEGEIVSTQPVTYVQTPTAPPLDTDEMSHQTTPMSDLHAIPSELMEREAVKPDALCSEIEPIES